MRERIRAAVRGMRVSPAVDETDAQWLGTPGAPHPHGPTASAAAGHLDLKTLEESNGAESPTLGPEATQWAQSLLEVARFELARADDKANTLFRFYGVVAALSIGLLAGQGASPTNLDVAGQVLFWT